MWQFEPRYIVFLWNNNEELPSSRWTHVVHCRPAIWVSMLIRMTTSWVITVAPQCLHSYKIKKNIGIIHHSINHTIGSTQPGWGNALLNAGRWGTCVLYITNEWTCIPRRRAGKHETSCPIMPERGPDCSAESTRSEDERERETEQEEKENSRKAMYASAWEGRDNWESRRLGLMETGHSWPLHDSSVRDFGRGPYSRICLVNISSLMLTFAGTFDLKLINRRLSFFNRNPRFWAISPTPQILWRRINYRRREGAARVGISLFPYQPFPLSPFNLFLYVPVQITNHTALKLQNILSSLWRPKFFMSPFK